MSALLVDGRSGSNELLDPLRKLGLPVEETTLEFGDLAFMGRGEGGEPLYIGIEHKKVNDLISSLNSERLQGHQLLGMLGVFDDVFAGFDRRHLIIEGDWAANSHGHVTMFRGHGARRPVRGAPNAVELLKRLLVIGARMGVEIHRCPTRNDTLNFILALFRMWTDKDLDQHKSHLAMYAPDLDKGLFKSQPSDFRKALSVLLPGVHSSVSKAVEDDLGGPDERTRVKLLRMLAWTAKDWAEVMTRSDTGKVRRLGESRAKNIMESL